MFIGRVGTLSTASVVVFTPPPVDDGEAPINIKTKVNIYETGVAAR